jgi:hypothetical protein
MRLEGAVLTSSFDAKLMRSHMRIPIFRIIAMAILAFIVTSSCSGRHSKPGIAGISEQSSREQALVGVLMDELAARGIDAKRALSCPPSGDCNKATGVEAIPDGIGGWLLRWRYVNHGDYNRDGAVNVADVTPLAAHYGENNTVIGGDGLRTIDVSDVTPIAQHFATEVAGFKVDAGPSATGPWEEIGRVSFASLVEANGRLHGQIALTAIDNRYYIVTPYDSSEAMGVCSDPYTPSLSAPVITAVRPLTCCVDVASEFEADVTGDGLITYAWDFGQNAAPQANDDANPSVIFLQAGDAQCTLTVSTIFGSDEFSFTVDVVETGDAPYITNVQPKSSLEGVPVVFGAIVGGDEPIYYSWSFEGGEPSISDKQNPEVTFADAGLHEVSLTVANAIDSAVYSFSFNAVAGLEINSVSIRIRVENTKNTLSSSIYKNTDKYTMPLSLGNAQGEGNVGSAIHGYLESISYNYIPEDQMYGFDDAPPADKSPEYNATLEYLRSQLEWAVSLEGYTEPELITHNSGELPGELLGTIGLITGVYTVNAELPAGVLGLTEPIQIIIDMNFINGS